jgi:2-dehydropantoate 2-reductase
MDRIETVALVGLGAIGASYIAKVSEKVPMTSLRVVASGDRARRYRSDGVSVNGKKYFFPIVESRDETAPADLVIFAVKYYSLTGAIADAKNQIGPDTIIISLLNGITSERDISDVYGAGHTLLSVSMALDATRAGDSTVNSTIGFVQFGEAVNIEGQYSHNVKLVREFFERTGIPYEIHEDMQWTLWKKFMLNVGFNQTSAVLRFPYGLMHKTEAARSIARSAMEEVVTLAACEDVKLNEADIKDAFARMDSLSPTGKTSMLQDVEAKRLTEVGIFGETVTALGLKHGVPTPVNDMLARLLHAIEESYVE